MTNKPLPSGGQLTSRRLGRVAVVHSLKGGEVAVAWVTLAGGALTVERHQRLAARGLAAALKTTKSDATIGIIPGAQCPLRMVSGPAPAGEEGEILSALALIAEANLPSNLPEHRRTAGVLRAGSATGTCAAGWTGDAPEGFSEVGIDAWITAPVALCGLLHVADGSGVVLAADGGSGVIITVAADGKQVTARVLREDPADEGPWREAVRGALATACTLAGREVLPAQTIEFTADGSALVRPSALRVSGAPDDAAWWRTFGPMIGGAAVAMQEGTLSRALFSMTAQPPVIKTQPLVSLVNWLGRPRVAACVGIIALAGLLLAPLGIAYGRLYLLRKQAAAAPGTDAQYASAQQQADFYSLLRERRWPMTQLMGEIIGSAPAGVSLESVSMDQGQPIRIQGTTATDDLVTQEWRTALRASQVFDEVSIISIDNTNLPTRFTLELKVGQPTLALSREAAKLPAVAVQVPVEIEEGSSNGGSSGNSNVSGVRPARNDGAGRTPGRTTTAPTPAAKRDVPKPLSDEQIAALPANQVMVEWAKRRGASLWPELDQTTKDRLADEAAKLNLRRTAPGGGGS